MLFHSLPPNDRLAQSTQSATRLYESHIGFTTQQTTTLISIYTDIRDICLRISDDDETQKKEAQIHNSLRY
jgi:hypothetical protein